MGSAAGGRCAGMPTPCSAALPIEPSSLRQRQGGAPGTADGPYRAPPPVDPGAGRLGDGRGAPRHLRARHADRVPRLRRRAGGGLDGPATTPRSGRVRDCGIVDPEGLTPGQVPRNLRIAPAPGRRSCTWVGDARSDRACVWCVARAGRAPQGGAATAADGPYTAPRRSAGTAPPTPASRRPA